MAEHFSVIDMSGLPVSASVKTNLPMWQWSHHLQILPRAAEHLSSVSHTFGQQSEPNCWESSGGHFKTMLFCQARLSGDAFTRPKRGGSREELPVQGSEVPAVSAGSALAFWGFSWKDFCKRISKSPADASSQTYHSFFHWKCLPGKDQIKRHFP